VPGVRNISAVAAAIGGSLPLSESLTHAFLEDHLQAKMWPMQTQEQQHCQPLDKHYNGSGVLPTGSATSGGPSQSAAVGGVTTAAVAAAGGGGAGPQAGSGQEERSYQVHRPSTLPASRTWCTAADGPLQSGAKSIASADQLSEQNRVSSLNFCNALLLKRLYKSELQHRCLWLPGLNPACLEFCYCAPPLFSQTCIVR
jgi:hypothetical protein